MKSMQSDAMNAVAETVEDAVKPLLDLKNVKSVQDVERITGRRIDIEKALRDKKVDPSTVKSEELNMVIQDALPGIVKQAAQPFMKRLESLKSFTACTRI